MKSKIAKAAIWLGERRRINEKLQHAATNASSSSAAGAASQLKSSKAKASINGGNAWRKLPVKMAKEIVNIKRRVASKM
jgi:hypothetical protein